MDSTALDLLQQMRSTEKKYQQAFEQILLVSNDLKACEKRYHRANDQGNMSFLYTYRMRRDTLKHTLHAYWTFTGVMEKRLEQIETQLMDEFNIDWIDHL